MKFYENSDRKYVTTSSTASRPSPKVLKHFSCSTQLSLKFQCLIKTEIAQIF